MDEKTKITCDLLGVAINMEIKAKEFYDRFAASCVSGDCKKIFTMLAADEAEHKIQLQKIHDSLASGDDWCEWKDHDHSHQALVDLVNGLSKEFDAKAANTAGDIEALGVGIELEGEGVKFYDQRLKDTDDPVEKEFLEKIIVEERGHYRALVDMKRYLRGPGAWCEEKEKGGLDGA